MHRTVPRFTVRQLMVAVAIVGIVLGFIFERRSRFGKIADRHREDFKKLASQLPHIGYGDPSQDPIWRRLEWHEAMRLKYERAALKPWLPVRPDLPAPN